ncbi:hypothetical protein VOLCADRAFT_89093 [Volvox carteri f. nagariensis]|uniref:Pherophorin domain-containing protein n=1 Tax=Volvox carteri f. nagariensis TaxID=3068 RepID=D8TQS4_VOLCA|nr:uncharacterized protein VOLCADRAFT_89093 [Volvox carteri f. nagariensis]EFJ50205.1 hypothetical protein VOLCADRAFT_89093 [Volvox carteri f. nagariensis]|eukprot:XP_002948825.1 hypothetical protein VOLCADRAFT_89093 [Volvox carteri f. nagariensis]
MTLITLWAGGPGPKHSAGGGCTRLHSAPPMIDRIRCCVTRRTVRRRQGYQGDHIPGVLFAACRGLDQPQLLPAVSLGGPSGGGANCFDSLRRMQMLADLSNQPVVSSITVSETGQVLPQYGGNIIVYVGTPITRLRSPPPPPPPPSPAPSPAPSLVPSNTMLVSSFPFGSGCILGRDATQSPVRLSAPLGPMNVTSSTATYCLLISSNASLVSPTAECAGMDSVRRVDMVVDATCVQQKPKPITVVTVNGRVPQHNLQIINFDGAEYGVLTIKRIDSLFQSIPDNGLSVCLTFNKAASGCSRPRALFFGPTIVYQVTSIDFMCCPTSEAPES